MHVQSMRGFRRSTGALAAILASTALISPAAAQSSAPPEFTNVDGNGVDLTTGLVSFSMKEGGIGSGPGAIEFARIFAQEGGWTDNWTGGMYYAEDYQTIVVQLGGISETFTESGGVYTSQKANGGTLTVAGSTYTYRASDGTRIDYTDSGVSLSWCPGNATISCKVPTSITRPDGLKYTLTWDQVTKCPSGDNPCTTQILYWRPTSVSSSAGYVASITYLTNDSGASNGLNWDWEKRAGITFNNTVAAPSPLPTISYSSCSFANCETNVTDTGSRVWVLGTDSEGRIASVRRPGAASNTTTYAYGAAGTVTSVANEGVTTTYNRVVSSNIATMTVTNALNQSTIVTSDLTIGRPTSVQSAGRTTSYQYDANSRMTRTTEPEGNYTQLTYDARGNVTESRAVAKAGTGLADIVTSASYVATCTNTITCNKPNSTTDARGNVTDFTYDATHGGLLTVTAPAAATGAVRPQSRFTYTGVTAASGDVVQVLSKVSACQTLSSCANAVDEIKTTAVYNSNLLTTSVSSGSGNGALTATQSMTYDPVGNLLTVDGPLAGTADTIRYRYNTARQVVGVTSADPDGGGSLKHRSTRATYTNGLRTRVEVGTVNDQSDAAWTAFAPAEVVDITRDANSRVTQQKLSNAGTAYTLAQISYDALGRPECVAQRMNTAVYGTLPPSACTLGTQGGFGPDQITKTVYDAGGQVTQQQAAVGTAHQVNEHTLTYLSNGQLWTLTDAENNKTTYVYDGHDRLAETHYPVATKGAGTSSPTNYEAPLYDASSNVVSKRLRDGQQIFLTYDNLDRVTLKNLPGAEPDVTYAYDALSRLTSASYTGHSLSFTYDALSRNLTQVGPQGTVTSEWDLAGRRTKLTYPGSGLYVNYDYLVTGETTKIRENGATSGVGVLATLAYDDVGRRTSLAFGNGAIQSYGYDAVSRLSTLTANLSGTANDLTIGSISYNPAGQIMGQNRSNDAYSWSGAVAVNRNYTANGLNQYTASGSITPTYDNRGNVTSAGTTTYAYSSENRLLSASTGAALSYDPGLRLYQVAAGGVTTRFGYDGLDLVAEYNGSNSLLRRYVHGPGIDQPLVQYEGSGTTVRRFLSADERGSIAAVTDGSGNLFAANNYDEYGIPGSANYGRFQYTGQVWLPELGMYYYKNRIYSPTLGRFLQTDPIGTAGGINLYGYVGNDPVNFADPLGLCGPGQARVYRGTIGSGDWGGEFTIRAVYVCMDLPETDYSSGGRNGGPGGGGTPPAPPAPPDPNKAVCEGLESDVNDAKSALSGFVTNFPVWNDIKGLQAELAWIQGDLAQLKSVQNIAGYVDDAGKIGGWGSVLAKRLLGGVIGLASVIGSRSLDARVDRLQQQTAAIKARIRQLQAVKGKTCG